VQTSQTLGSPQYHWSDATHTQPTNQNEYPEHFTTPKITFSNALSNGDVPSYEGETTDGACDTYCCYDEYGQYGGYNCPEGPFRNHLSHDGRPSYSDLNSGRSHIDFCQDEPIRNTSVSDSRSETDQDYNGLIVGPGSDSALKKSLPFSQNSTVCIPVLPYSRERIMKGNMVSSYTDEIVDNSTSNCSSSGDGGCISVNFPKENQLTSCFNPLRYVQDFQDFAQVESSYNMDEKKSDATGGNTSNIYLSSPSSPRLRGSAMIKDVQCPNSSKDVQRTLSTLPVCVDSFTRHQRANGLRVSCVWDSFFL